MEKREELYKGKAKSVYTTDDPDALVLFFRNDTSAFDGKKIEQLDRKGMVNNKFNAFIMEKLEAAGIETHFTKLLSDQESLVKSLKMMPLECVVRNISAGSICRRLGVEEGLDLNPPTFEFFLKNDDLGDPMVNEYHIKSFGWAEKEHVEKMQELTFQVNTVLKQLFLEGGMLLVDYKLEFGLYQGRVVLGDEFTPDGCRLWDKETRKKLDKDRFRQGLGGVVESYEEVGARLGMKFD
ncbi:phosphoribosylaminoimidazolesuccinocarboxamide synthase [Ketobacter sp. MCCC 1A13808]|uniref:phosphoribosylaminoimidazolesuccinocarboxamide synthase n=1 Tax=Ketobacter sp. MCCC 1A13808 TaxID=2602738 RepID=UPI000F1D19D4|nr:phosphoribosylaminoimidazolesuccinocarboxamide synthase [Ketobacter sp. MCCC 1A13808]MVF10732.1 phosphoribosylaminoimidazolesuccinocarboxamide synthase [Ketobacter sp. MCCC 1A13808]RLP56149.1 MAG: phosphoribosylaminoimidazolesuccinocarboxamide synthase [Ketobacter sp.]